MRVFPRGLLFYVEVFGVFADDDEVNGGGGGADSFYGADVGVEVEAFAELDDRGRVAGGRFCWGAIAGVLVRVLRALSARNPIVIR